MEDDGLIARENVTLSISASTLLANDTDPNNKPLSITGVGNATHGTVSYDSIAKTVMFVPTAGYTGNATFTYSISNGSGGTSTGTVGLLVNDPASSSLFSLTSVPTLVTANDPNSVELGVKFVASANGIISGIRFYKGATNTGSTAETSGVTGKLLASANFTNETVAGWQQVNFEPGLYYGRHYLCSLVPYQWQLFRRHGLFRSR